MILILKLELKEVSKKKNKETRFESKDSLFHKKVSFGFQKLKEKKKVEIFSGDKSKNEVHKNIVDFLNKKKLFNKQIPYYYEY